MRLSIPPSLAAVSVALLATSECCAQNLSVTDQYPDCAVLEGFYNEPLGDGQCSGELNNPECGFDGGRLGS